MIDYTYMQWSKAFDFHNDLYNYNKIHELTESSRSILSLLLLPKIADNRRSAWAPWESAIQKNYLDSVQ